MAENRISCGFLKEIFKRDHPFKTSANFHDFYQLPAVKKDTIFGAARKNFVTSCFVMALTLQAKHPVP